MERGRTAKHIEEGEHERKGTMWSASTHIIAAVIGSGVLALAWSMAQLGWVLGPLVILGFSIITYYTSTLLADCYRYPDPITGTPNRVYIDAVRAYLGQREVFFCGCAQYINLWGTLVGYTVTAAISMMQVESIFHKYSLIFRVCLGGLCINNIVPKSVVWEQGRERLVAKRRFLLTHEERNCEATVPPVSPNARIWAVQRSNCFHRNGHDSKCESSGNLFMFIFGVMQIVLSQFPNLENITWLSVVAVATSFAYSFIGLGLSTSKLITHKGFKGNLYGAAGSSHTTKTWNVFLALGNVAFAYTFADVLIEIQDTLKAPPPEKKTMKRASFIGIGLTTAFYLSLGCIGYAAFGNKAPGNILTGFGFFEPFWLVDIANICIVVHLLGAYQVYAQPIFGCFENILSKRWPEAKFLHKIYSIRLPFSTAEPLNFTLSKLVLRSCLILLTTLVAMLVPFFNAVLGLLGAIGFWPLTVYFPINMHIAQRKIKRGNLKWILLQGLSLVCLLISIATSIGSMADIISSLKKATPFKISY